MFTWFFRLLLLITFLASALIFAPAQLLATLIQSATQHRVLLSKAEGSLWRGRGEVWIASEQGDESMGYVTWAWQWRSLAQGQLTLILSRHQSAQSALQALNANAPSNNANPSSSIVFSWQQVQWQLSDWTIPLMLISEFLPADISASWRDLKAGGQLNLDQFQGKARWTGLLEESKATITWRNAQLVSFPVSPLGDYRMEINPVSGTPQAYAFNLTTQRGPLTIEGEGQFSPQSLNAKLTMIPDEKNKITLKPMLSFWGKEQDKDRYDLHINNLTR